MSLVLCSGRATVGTKCITPCSKSEVLHARPESEQHLYIVYGPAGCGKTTIGMKLATHLEIPYIEGDAFHSADAIATMKNNQPLTDSDRWDWLIRLREQARTLFSDGVSGVVLSCSALKQKYRDVIRIIALETACVVHFIYLKIDAELLMTRMRARKNHFMKHSMVSGQIAILEEPQDNERDIVTVEVDQTVSKILEDIITHLNLPSSDD